METPYDGTNFGFALKPPRTVFTRTLFGGGGSCGREVYGYRPTKEHAYYVAGLDFNARGHVGNIREVTRENVRDLFFRRVVLPLLLHGGTPSPFPTEPQHLGRKDTLGSQGCVKGQI
jgi:hypothetical protein